MSEEELRRGIELFNQGKFFESHEALEDVWRAAAPHEKRFFQGLVQVAVGFHHHSTGNSVGMRSVLQRAAKNLAGAPSDFTGIDLHQFLNSLEHWLDSIEQGLQLSPPHIQRISGRP